MKKLLFLFIVIASIAKQAQAQIINTIAGTGVGGYTGDGGQATNAKLYYPTGVVIDAVGNLYIADYNNQCIRKVTASGVITTVAGTGTLGYGGDGGAATAAKLNYPFGVAVDAAGNLYIADYSNQRIRKVTTSGVISTYVGNGTQGVLGDGGAATAAELTNPYGVAFDAIGNLYIADASNRIRKVTTTGIINTIAGNGTAGYSGDGGVATAAELNFPDGVAIDAIGNVYIADYSNQRIRKVTSAGIISTVAGTGTAGYAGDGAIATAAELYWPNGVATDATGNLYIADYNNNRIRMVNTLGIISTIAGNGIPGHTGDGGQATAAEIQGPAGVAIDAVGNLYIGDQSNNKVRKIALVLSITANPASICFGGTTTLTASGATTYSWSPATSLSATTGSMVTASPTVTTTYTVMGTTGASTVSTAVTVSVNPLPSYTLAANIYTICDGGSVTFTVSGASTYTWVPASSLTGANTANPTASPTTTTIYSVTGTNSFGCTNATAATVTVNVVPPPNLILSSNSYTICNGSSQGLFVSGASTYTWTPASSLTGANTANPTASPTTTTIYTVSGTASGCAPSAPVIVTVVVNPLPTVSIFLGGSNPMCLGSLDSLTASHMLPGTTYSWMPANSYTVNPTYPYQVAISPTINTTYTVIANYSGCVSSPAVLTVAVKTSPVSTGSITGTSPVCLDNTIGGGIPPYIGGLTYNWNITAGGVILSGQGTTSVTVNVPTSGTYTLSVISSNACGISAPATFPIIVNPLPTVTCSATPDTILVGSSSILNASGATTYSWAPAATLSAVTGNSVVATPIVATCYTVLATDGNGCEATCNICVHVNNSTGISKLVGSNDITIYPNPAKDVLNVEYLMVNANSTLVMTDMLGNTIKQVPFHTQHLTFNISDLGEGVYNISIISNEGIINKRIVIVK